LQREGVDDNYKVAQERDGIKSENKGSETDTMKKKTTIVGRGRLCMSREDPIEVSCCEFCYE